MNQFTLTEEEQNYVDKYCPYAVGEKIRMISSYSAVINDSKYIRDGVVTGILPRTIKDRVDDLKYRMPPIYYVRQLLDYYNTLDEHELNKLCPEFIITYEYEELQPRKKWWKFWEKKEYKKRDSSIVVDIEGKYVNDYYYYGKHTIIKLELD